MDYESLIAGLLHDTVEDTDVISFEDIGNQFGPAVRRIVEGETKFSKIGRLTPKCSSSADLKVSIKNSLYPIFECPGSRNWVAGGKKMGYVFLFLTLEKKGLLGAPRLNLVNCTLSSMRYVI